MIFTKITLVNGDYLVKCYNQSGQQITDDFSIRSELHVKREGKYILSDIIEGASGDLSATSVKESYIYVSLYLNDTLHKAYMKVPVVNNKTSLSYTVLYKTSAEDVELSNMFLNRFSYFMPKWSAAYKNDVSVFSKICYPYFSNIEKLFYKTSDAVDISLKGSQKYYDKVFRVQAKDVGKVEGKEGQYIKYSYSPENSSYNKATLLQEKVRGVDLKTITEVPTRLRKATNLYVKAPLNSVMILRGQNEEGLFITETLTFKTLNPKVTSNAFKTIEEICCTTDTFDLKTYADHSETHIVEAFQDISSFSNSSKKVQIPNILLDNDTISVETLNENSVEISDVFLLPEVCNGALVSKRGDVIVLTEEGLLKAGLLRKNLAVNMPLLPSNNNTHYIVCDDIDTEKKEVTFDIDCKSLYSNFESNTAYVEIQTDNETHYFSSITKSLEKEVSALSVDKHNRLRLRLNYEDYSFISVIVKIDDKSFQASYRNDRISLSTIAEGAFEKLLSINENVYVKDNLGTYFKVSLEKEYYEVTEEGFLLLPSKDTKVYNNKGRLIYG